MMWFAWRQFRLQLLIVCAVLAAVAVFMLLTGPHMSYLYDSTVKPCNTYHDCSVATSALLLKYDGPFQLLRAFSLFFPVLLGMFWGAPLIARELETGTFRLAWSQGVTRSRWILTKLALVGSASVIAVGLMSWMLTWWASPLDTINANRFASLVFDTSYVAPLGYALFAFALGVTAGVLLRRTLPAMAVTLVVFVAARVPFADNVRPRLITPIKQVVEFTRKFTNDSGYGFSRSPSGLAFSFEKGNRPNALIFTTNVVDKHGVRVTPHWLATNCPQLLKQSGVGVQKASGVGPGLGASPAPTGVKNALFSCIDKVAATFHEVLTYQPASRFWPFQWIEMSIYAVAGLALCALSYWWVRRRIA